MSGRRLEWLMEVNFVHIIKISLFYCSSSLSIEENVLDNLLNNRYFPSLTAAERPSNQDKDVRTMRAGLLIVELLHLLASVDNKA